MIEEHGKYTVEAIETRSGQIEDEQGYMQGTYNCYAGVGYEEVDGEWVEDFRAEGIL